MRDSMKIGIVGSGNIIKSCLDALSKIKGYEINSICVRPNSKDKALVFADQYRIEHIYTDYDQFLQESDVDIVYVGVVNSVHYEYTKKALLVGKNVICEKPFTSKFWELEELSRIAREKKSFLFEAITLLHFQNFKWIQNQLSKIGDIKLIQCNYSQFSSRYPKYKQGEVLPVFDPELSGGALYDLNIYNLHFVIALFGKPQNIQYFPNRGFNGIDTSGICILNYEQYQAVCTAAKDSSSPNFAIIQGENGYIKVHGAVNQCPKVELGIEGNIQFTEETSCKNYMIEEFISFLEISQNNDLIQCYTLLDHSMFVMENIERARIESNIIFTCDR